MPQFWKSFAKLTKEQKARAREKFQLFKQGPPWDKSLNVHKIEKLSARAKETVRSVTVEGNLKAVFVVRGDTTISLDIGTHDIYK